VVERGRTGRGGGCTVVCEGLEETGLE
jgi:hypothetical protein